jgi:hypothetical protein
MQLSAFPFARLLICLALGALTVACDADKKSDKKSVSVVRSVPTSRPLGEFSSTLFGVKAIDSGTSFTLTTEMISDSS